MYAQTADYTVVGCVYTWFAKRVRLFTQWWCHGYQHVLFAIGQPVWPDYTLHLLSSWDHELSHLQSKVYRLNMTVYWTVYTVLSADSLQTWKRQEQNWDGLTGCWYSTPVKRKITWERTRLTTYSQEHLQSHSVCTPFLVTVNQKDGQVAILKLVEWTGKTDR